MAFFQKNRIFADSDATTNNPEATLYSTKVTIATADVLTSFATPVLLIAAPPAGYFIKVESVFARIVFNTIAYATNQSGIVYTDTSTLSQYAGSKILGASIDSTIEFSRTQGAGGATDKQHIAGKSIYYQTSTGNPTAGNSSFVISLSYRIVAVL